MNATRPKPTARQLEILKVYEREDGIKQTAQRLGLSTKTVEYHLVATRSKLGIPTNKGLISWAFRSGLIPVDRAS